MRVSPLFLALLAVTVLGGVLATLDNGFLVTTGVVLIVLGGWATSLCLHEFGHAITAFRGGDRAVRAKGYLTLDPRHYTDPVLSLLLPILFVLIGGIPLPGGAVWINHAALRSKKDEATVSLAGPVMNLLIGIGLTASVATIAMPYPLAAGLSYLAFLQVIAFVLNILPIPGLDGYGAIEPWLSPQARQFGEQARPWAPLGIILVLVVIPGVGSLFFEAAFALFDTVGGTDTLAIHGSSLFRFWERL
ncbi:site-2 protease family protein [Actinopolyspora mortivallis]|uniref:Site-2 protease family protein n=1 Tax=Actinopolyspora mortivallis TaxID=33906 RepID=A0A2T0GUB1_ACTMO|nr:site-2 protease family protein [Actinopolyspora mortivallis]PRW62699.1 site-2 protease family protein [Actinopolyspora mortivallis]